MLWRSYTHNILNWKKSYWAIATAYSLSATIRLFLRSMWRTPLHGRPTQPRSTQSRVWRSGGCHLFSRASLSTTSGKAGSTCWSTARNTWWCCPPQPSSRSWGWSSDAKHFYNRLLPPLRPFFRRRSIRCMFRLNTYFTLRRISNSDHFPLLRINLCHTRGHRRVSHL